MKIPLSRWTLYTAVLVLYVLHNDLWLWNNPRLILGMPVGLLYHIGYCLAAAVLMTLLVTYAWPAHLDVEEQGEGQS